MSCPRKTRFWHLSMSRLRLKRDSPPAQSISDVYHSMPSTSADDAGMLDDQKDGFYRYSESLLVDEDTKSVASSLIMRPSVSMHSTLCDESIVLSSRPHSRPYTVSSDEWVIPSSNSSSSASQVLSLDDLSTVQLAVHLGNVLKIYTRIYAMSKVLYVVFLAYGVELDVSETGLFYWVQRAEAEIRTDSLAVLIEIVENLFYTVYSTIEFEMANIELCALFKMNPRPATTHEQFYLPDPNHLYRIFLAFKDVLDSPLVCEKPHSAIVQDTVTQYQEDHVRRLILKEVARGFTKDDLLGYRRYALNIVSERTSAYCKKWSQLIGFFSNIPSEVMTVMSEKYFTRIPRVVPGEDVTATELGFVDLKTNNPGQWGREIILDHRVATLAKLEGKSVGEERRDDPKVRLLAIVKYHKCVCTSLCFCARECTYNVERWCPCAERQLRLMLARRRKGTGRFSFATRANNLARFCFQGLATLRRDISDDCLVAELGTLFDMFDVEIQRERSGVALNWI